MYPRIIDPTIRQPDMFLDLCGLQNSLVIILNRQDASRLAIALHEFDRPGAHLSAPLLVLREQLDRIIINTRARPEAGMAEITASRRQRRDWLADELAEEERLLAAGQNIRMDLNPGPNHPAVIAAAEQPLTPFVNDAKDWTSYD